MSSTIPTLHLLCGKIASGKSTLTAELGRTAGTVVIAEDDWLNGLYSEEMSSMSDYMRCMSKFRKVMAPHVVSLLNEGISVVLDFQANTIASRDWMRSILERTKAAHKLHVLDVADEVCIARLHARNAQGDHPFAATEEQFRKISEHFVAPSPEEGFNIVLHHVDTKL
ncbi:AAA family ATPase [Maritalea porphyrae]|uniref:AAA family ATPase n=1 Tax=Maritalea porphyrae TaxID=880732 RepID=UPI0022AF6A22|nr:ATP-binding protein [Maritalea porphyrae]MCZ4274129.1 ATP-binding protein [Maritalea porphyrae]